MCKDSKTLQREEPLHGITPEEVEDMWTEFMDETEPHTKKAHQAIMTEAEEDTLENKCATCQLANVCLGSHTKEADSKQAVEEALEFDKSINGEKEAEWNKSWRNIQWRRTKK